VNTVSQQLVGGIRISFLVGAYVSPVLGVLWERVLPLLYSEFRLRSTPRSSGSGLRDHLPTRAHRGSKAANKKQGREPQHSRCPLRYLVGRLCVYGWRSPVSTFSTRNSEKTRKLRWTMKVLVLLPFLCGVISAASLACSPMPKIGIDISQDLETRAGTDATACCDLCSKTDDCSAWTVTNSTVCALKKSTSGAYACPKCESGVVSPAAFICTGSSANLDLQECKDWQSFYDATNGPQWKACSSNRATPCDCQDDPSGQGLRSKVTCNDRHITELWFIGNGLSGNLSALASPALPNLERFDTACNSMQGDVPSLSIFTNGKMDSCWLNNGLQWCKDRGAPFNAYANLGNLPAGGDSCHPNG
jgi:hypothetical protein